jgi:hypothetical protein
MSRSTDIIDPMAQLRIDTALIVFDLKMEIVYPEWYDRGVYLFRCFGYENITYTFDTNACNALMCANGKDGRSAPPLPHWPSDEGMIEVIQCLMRNHGALEVSLKNGDAWVAEVRGVNNAGYRATDKDELGAAVCKAAIGYVRSREKR